MFIVKESILREFLIPAQTFFAVPVELDPGLVARIYKVQQDAHTAGEYLAALKVGDDIGVPACLDVEVASESPPVKKDTAATSSTKSRKSSKRTAAEASVTSRRKVV